MRALLSIAVGAVIAVMLWCAPASASGGKREHPDQQGKACAACHEDAHHGEFTSRKDGGACGGCHTTKAFSPSTFDAALHTATTKYALDGKHVATPCSGCHPGAKPRTSFVLASSDCLDCHQNPHGQEFAAQQAKGGCVECHSTANWKQWKVDHTSWPLAGAHGKAACSACHPGKTIATPAAQMRGIATTCEGCHPDVHAKQFAGRACASCHDAQSWAATKFDHGKTRYPLEGVHVAMACGKCHRAVELHDGDRVRAWRLPYFQCKDCHADPHPKGAAGSMDCRGCHAATSWAAIDPKGGGGAFDHDKTGFVLRASHAKASCTTCHGTKRVAFGGGTSAGGGRGGSAGAKTSNSTCQNCHPDPHMGRMAGQCFECHTAVAWQDTAMFEQHRRTRMPLTGKHAVIECGACHRRQGERPFRDLPSDCWGCHATEYKALPTHTGASGDEPYSRQCQECHTTIDWAHAIDPGGIARVARKRAEHERVFSLTSGSHVGVACEGCHVDGKRMRATRCDGCHPTEALRTQHKQAVPATAAAACLGCHPRGARR